MTEIAPATPTTTPTTLDFARGLRELADFYEAHPEFPVPTYPAFMIHGPTQEAMVALARSLGRAEKIYTSNFFLLRRLFSGGLQLEAYSSRDAVCTARVVGQRVEPAYEIPAQHIPERVVDVVEWDCHPLLAEAGAEAQPGAQAEENPRELPPSPEFDPDIPF